jgi:hypothetical protein
MPKDSLPKVLPFRPLCEPLKAIAARDVPPGGAIKNIHDATDGSLDKLARYIASRPELDSADPSEIEAALKKAGRISAGDHFRTAFYARLKAIRLRRGRRGMN